MQSFRSEILRVLEGVLSIDSTWLIMSPSEDEYVGFRGRDIDLVVEPTSVRSHADRLCDEFRAQGYLVSVTRRWDATQLYLLRQSDQGARIFNVDLVGHVQWKGWEYVPFSALYARPRAKRSYMVSSLTHDAYRYLREWFWEGRVLEPERYESRVGETSVTGFNSEVEAIAADALGTHMATRLAAQLSSSALPIGADTLAPDKVRRTLVLRSVSRHPLSAVVGWLSWRFAAVIALARPRGLMVALIGPDGSGKSAIAASLVQGYGEGLFNKDRSVVLHWRPGLLPKPSSLVGGPSTVSDSEINSPRERKPHGVIVSIIRALYFFADYWFGYLVKIRPALGRGALVVFDRYGYDIVLDPIRYRLHPRVLGLTRLLFLRMIPRPDVTLFLDLPSDMAHARKPDLTVQEIESYLVACRSLAGDLVGATVVDASRCLDEVVHNALDAVFQRYFR